jgi:hypothetical protein
MNILNSNLVYSGVYSGPHAGLGHLSCFVFAETYADNIDDTQVVLT